MMTYYHALLVLLLLWLSWCGFNLLCMYYVQPTLPAYTGFRIVLPDDINWRLSVEQAAAVWEHEEGHKFHGHVWYNFMRVCFFCPVGPDERARQEAEADDYAAIGGHARDLAAAIRLLSRHPADMARAERLESMYGR